MQVGTHATGDCPVSFFALTQAIGCEFELCGQVLSYTYNTTRTRIILSYRYVRWRSAGGYLQIYMYVCNVMWRDTE